MKIPDFFTKYEFWLSLTTSLTAIIALFQSHKGVKISNKQKLLEKRLNNYLVIDELASLFEKSQNGIENLKTISYLEVRPIFICLTDATLLKRMRIDFFHPFKENNSDDFFEVTETLHSTAVETSLIWKGKSARIISGFISDYNNLLSALHIQHAYITSEEVNPTLPNNSLENKSKEMANHIELQKKIESAIKSYNDMVKKGAIKKIKKQIKL